jgi:hypothetical protein
MDEKKHEQDRPKGQEHPMPQERNPKPKPEHRPGHEEEHEGRPDEPRREDQQRRTA